MTVATIQMEDYQIYNLAFRYGGSLPSHPEIEAILGVNLNKYDDLLQQFTVYIEQFLLINKMPCEESPQEPAWINVFIPAFDTITLFGMISAKKPNIYLEIGSGNSTKIAAKAKKLNSPNTKIISIDPHPTTEIDPLCDEIIRKPLEKCDFPLTDLLSKGDILFFDGSHRVLQNSDCTVLFLEIIPRIKSGVYIHLHDIFWPDDYPEEWSKRMYSEQYLLGLLMLFGWDKFETILPNYYISSQTPLLSYFDKLWNAPHLEGIQKHGGSFWFTKK